MQIIAQKPKRVLYMIGLSVERQPQWVLKY